MNKSSTKNDSSYKKHGVKCVYLEADHRLAYATKKSKPGAKEGRQGFFYQNTMFELWCDSTKRQGKKSHLSIKSGRLYFGKRAQSPRCIHRFTDSAKMVLYFMCGSLWNTKDKIC